MICRFCDQPLPSQAVLVTFEKSRELGVACTRCGARFHLTEITITAPKHTGVDLEAIRNHNS